VRSWGITLLVLLGCNGVIEDPDAIPPVIEVPEPDVIEPPPPPEEVCTDIPAPGRAPLRRLSVEEYDATLRDLLGDETRPGTRLIDPERGVTSADARVVTPLLAEQYLAAAEDVAARVTDDLPALMGCDPAAEGEDACATAFVEDFGTRAFRRPLSGEERLALVSLYEAGRDELGFETAVEMIVEAVLQSPHFLYRVEIVPEVADEVVRLDGYQLATRLSYLLWGTMPDPALMEAAAGGELDTDEGVERHARRMLEHERAEPAVQKFFHHLLELDHLEGLEKDPEVFPDFDEEIAALFERETEAFVHEVMIEGDGSWRTLMTAPWSMMNAELAEYYGVEGPTGEAMERVELDGRYHSGMLTHGSVLAPRSRYYETSPIHRGMFVRGTLLCGVVPDVPEGLEVTPPDPDPTKTTRERLAEHRADPVCASCHEQIDPLGFAFEHFDGAGRFRADENGLDIDASGALVETDIDGRFESAVDMAEQMLESGMAQACFTRHWFRFAHARGDESHDACSMATALDRFRGSGFDVRELIVGMTLTDAFLYRAVDQDAVAPEEETE